MSRATRLLGGKMRDLTLAFPSGFGRVKIKSEMSIHRLNLMMLAAILLFGLVYLFVVNSLGTKGYEIRNLESKVQQLEIDQKHLQIQASDMQSLNRIQIDAQKLNFVPTSNITYLKASDFALK